MGRRVLESLFRWRSRDNSSGSEFQIQRNPYRAGIDVNDQLRRNVPVPRFLIRFINACHSLRVSVMSNRFRRRIFPVVGVNEREGVETGGRKGAAEMQEQGAP